MKKAIAILGLAVVAGWSAVGPWTVAAEPARDPYKDAYAGYRPDFIPKIDKGSGFSGPYRGWKRTDEEMKLSTESSFFTLNILEEDSRANALVEAGLKKEQEGQYREALKIYQQVIDKYPQSMYRVSAHGVFVPVSQYCQRRILGFPAADLVFYRTLYDAQAREAFEQARRQYSLLGMADVTEKMLATSYGGKAVLELGNAALDTGHYLAALEQFTTVRDFFPDADLRTPELELKIAYCEKMLGSERKAPEGSRTGKSELSGEQLQRLREAVQSARVTRSPFPAQLASAPYVTADDYTLLPPTQDPLALQEPVWQASLPGSRLDFFVYTQPVVTGDSVIYRHKNIVYCRSILNGELRWTNDLGGRAVWQDWYERLYPQEDVLVQDGLVFTTINKAGPSLVALDEVTGQLKWAYGPMAAANEEEARMRFEAAPAGGPRTVYASYVLDNIEGNTHTDTEYGLIAFDSRTGRIHWRTPLCRLAPGKFAGGHAEQRRNRIRSFTSPPLYHQGTVYVNTNAGAIAAISSLSGRVKWLMRYPYYPEVHDATRVFGQGGDTVQYTRIFFRPHRPMLWYNQRPFLEGEQLFVLPVDSNMIFALDRRTGRVNWTTVKASSAAAYFLGMTKQHHLVVAYTGRSRQIDAEVTTSPIHLLDPATGKSIWESPDLVMPDPSPLMTHYVFASPTLHWRMNYSWFEMAARPLLTSDGRVHVTSFRYVGYPIYGWISNLGVLDLDKRQLVSQRRYYSGEIIARGVTDITEHGPMELEAFEKSPVKDDKDKRRIEMLKEVIADKFPENAHGPFLPFSRIPFERYGVAFELRLNPRTIEMVYDRAGVLKTLAARTDPEADRARAELAIADTRLDEAAALLQKCLQTISSEDLDLRAALNQQLYRVHQQLTRRAIRSSQPRDEMTHALGMSRTASTLAEEIETLFAVAEAHERRGDLAAASKALRTIIATYGQHEYPIAPLAVADARDVLAAARDVMARYRNQVDSTLLGKEMGRSLSLSEKGLPLYLSTVSPLPRTLTVRAGELAALRLIQMEGRSPEFAKSLEAIAQQELGGKPPEEQLQRLAEFPATPAAQKTLEALLEKTGAARQGDAAAAARLQLWKLTDAARVCGLQVPEAYRTALVKPAAGNGGVAIPQSPREHDFADEEGSSRLVLERHGDDAVAPHLAFIAAQVRKRLDNKFTLTALDLGSGKIAWDTGELRLKGKGQEPGFFEAFVQGDLVVVHGLYDVLAFTVADGKLRWRYQVPFDFEIRHAMLSGDLLVLAGKTETLALYVPTDNPLGEVAWQVKELGDLYIPPYVRGDRVISVRKLPFSVTVRYRSTGRLIGRLDLPDLSLHQVHPLLENGPAELPAAHEQEKLVLTDGWYYILIDTDRLQVAWKRLIDNSDTTRQPAMRFALGGDYLTVVKEDYDQKMLYVLSSLTGEILWQTEPKNVRSPQPMHSIFIEGGKVYGIQPHAGQGFYLVGRDGQTGKLLFREEVVGYQGKPEVRLRPRRYGDYLVAEVADRQTFELRAFDAGTGKNVQLVQKKGVGPFGIHGRISATVQHARLVLLSKDKLSY